MTRQHFEALAWALKHSKPEGPALDTPMLRARYAARLLQWQNDVKATADACYQFNGRFDRERFIDACGAR